MLVSGYICICMCVYVYRYMHVHVSSVYIPMSVSMSIFRPILVCIHMTHTYIHAYKYTAEGRGDRVGPSQAELAMLEPLDVAEGRG